MQLQSLRQIAAKVDQLLHTLNGDDGGEEPSLPRPAAQALERSLIAQLAEVVSVTSERQLHEKLVDVALSVTGGERAFLMLLEEGHKLRFKVGRNLDHRDLAGKEFAGARLLIKGVLQGGGSIALLGNDLPAHGLIHLKGVLVAPLKFGLRLDGVDRVHGAIYVDCLERAALDRPQLERLEVLCEHAGVAFENARLLAAGGPGAGGGEDPALARAQGEVDRLKENIARVHQVAQSINSTLYLPELLVNVVDHVVEVSRAQRGFVMLLEGPPGQEQLVYQVGRDAERQAIDEPQFRYSTTIARRTIAEREPVILVEPLGANLSLSIEQLELQSVMCVPLKDQQQVFGVVYVDSQQKNREFDQSDLEVVSALCGQASVAIVNAKLHRQAGERERLAHELTIASRLQRDLLPRVVPAVRGLELHGSLTPAAEVGGDYYDFIAHDGTDASLTVAIGDVSGKGVRAGLVMAMARSALRGLIQHHGVPPGPLPIMRSLNVLLCRDIPPEMFMTLNLLQWHAERREIVYTGAGHEHLLVYRAADERVEAIRAGGVACGVLEEASRLLTESRLTLAEGDQVLLYTDGVTEAMSPSHRPFGLEALIDVVRAHGRGPPAALCGEVELAVARHRADAPPHDDVTLVALRCRPA